MSATASPSKVKTKVGMSMKVTRAADGSVEDFGQQFEKVVELDFNTAVELLGQEQAELLFQGIKVDVTLERSDDGS